MVFPFCCCFPSLLPSLCTNNNNKKRQINAASTSNLEEFCETFIPATWINDDVGGGYSFPAFLRLFSFGFGVFVLLLLFRVNEGRPCWPGIKLCRQSPASRYWCMSPLHIKCLEFPSGWLFYLPFLSGLSSPSPPSLSLSLLVWVSLCVRGEDFVPTAFEWMAALCWGSFLLLIVTDHHQISIASTRARECNRPLRFVLLLFSAFILKNYNNFFFLFSWFKLLWREEIRIRGSNLCFVCFGDGLFGCSPLPVAFLRVFKFWMCVQPSKGGSWHARIFMSLFC